MDYDAIVIGGGIIGCTHAYYLAKQGLRVAVLEKTSIASGTTAHNFSWINASTKTQNAAYHRLNAHGVTLHAQLADQFGHTQLGQAPLGALGLVRRSDPGPYQTMRQTADALATLHYPMRWIDTDELRDLEPNLDLGDDAEALLTPTDTCLNAAQFTAVMAEQVRQMGGDILENCPAQDLIADGAGAVTGLNTALGPLRSPRIILATGPDTPQVLSDLTGYGGFAARFPVTRVPGLLVTTPPVPNNLVRHLNYTDTGGEFHFMPDFNGGLRLASDDVDGAIIADQSPGHLRRLATGLLDRMQALIPSFAGAALIDQCHIAIGVRAYPADGLSIAGQVPGADGLFVIATHSGVTLAPALGQLMTKQVAQGQTDDMLRPFGLERLPGFGD